MTTTIQPGKFGLSKYVQATGSLGIFDINGDTDLKFVISNANSGNIFTISGRIVNEDNYTAFGTMTGNGEFNFDVSRYDFLEISCTTYAPTTTYVEINGSGFISTGIININVPTGTNTSAVTTANFTSSDNSVTITGVSNGVIDFKAAGGGTTTKYTRSVALIDWTGPSAGEYTLTIPFTNHAIPSPVVSCFEANGSSYDLVMISVNVDFSNNITIKASSSPDTRFIGKIVIE